MTALHDVLLLVHVAFGFTGLVAFWVPVAARKGGRLHVRAGRVYLACAYVVAGSAILLSAGTIAFPWAMHPDDLPSDPAAVDAATAELRRLFAFLGYLGVITLATVHHGVRSIQHGRDPERLRTPFHTGVNALAIAAGLAVGAFGILTGTWLFLALAPIGPLQGTSALRYARRDPASRMAHWYEHLAGMLAGGIAFHTAFAVFGIQRFVDYSLDGIVGILPWVLPGVVGSIAIAVWTRVYRRRFGEA